MRKLRLREIGSDNYEMAKPRLGPLKTNFVTDLQWVGDLSMGQWVFCLELKYQSNETRFCVVQQKLYSFIKEWRKEIFCHPYQPLRTNGSLPWFISIGFKIIWYLTELFCCCAKRYIVVNCPELVLTLPQEIINTDKTWKYSKVTFASLLCYHLCPRRGGGDLYYARHARHNSCLLQRSMKDYICPSHWQSPLLS